MRTLALLIACMCLAACGPGPLPAFADPPDPPDASEDDAGAADGGD